jgi:hypothetical protein
MEYGEVFQDCKLGKLTDRGGCRANCGKHVPTVCSVKDLGRLIGCTPSIQAISRVIYKGTECGAWVDEHDGAIRIGSIVEGSDAEVATVVLPYPFTMERFWKDCEQVNAEACQVWDAIHDENGMELT